jgi:hypothetical protein
MRVSADAQSTGTAGEPQWSDQRRREHEAQPLVERARAARPVDAGAKRA